MAAPGGARLRVGFRRVKGRLRRGACLIRSRRCSNVELGLGDAQTGPQGATALAPALTKRALPSLEMLHLWSNQIGDAGLAALAPALRQLPKLEVLFLSGSQIADQGLASLLAPPTAGVLPSLHNFYLDDNQITDEGFAALASALRGGALLDDQPPHWIMLL